MRDERADAQRRQAVRLRERPADDQIAMTIERVADEGAAAELRVGLVDEHDRVRRRRGNLLERRQEESRDRSGCSDR